jgi:membrane-bound lytic murein transglycosylase MltF
MRVQYPRELGELSWSTIYERPDLQIRTIVLMTRDLYRHFQLSSYNNIEALAFMDAAYNGGRNGVDRERRACLIDRTCDHSKWFDNVERYCLKSKAALYGNRSACDINRHHVRDVLLIRANKYQKYF